MKNLSGGNYWGKPSQTGVANSLKEIFARVFSSSCDSGVRLNLTNTISQIESKYRYFNI